VAAGGSGAIGVMAHQRRWREAMLAAMKMKNGIMA
jgi:hypothetical protein